MAPPALKEAPGKVTALPDQNAFVALVANLGNGRTAIDAADKLASVVAAVKRTGKKGDLTLKITIKPDGKGEVESVDIEGRVKPNSPERDIRPTTYFIEGESSLVRDDPKQPELSFPAQARGVAAAN